MQALFILSAILLGILIPDGHHLTFLIRYNLMIMLFIAFLGIDYRARIAQIDHLKVLLLNIGLPMAAFYFIRPYDETLALSAFVIGIAPTAAGAPVIAGFLNSKVEFVTASVLFTSPIIATVLPFLLPFVGGASIKVELQEVVVPIAAVVFIPLAVSMFIKFKVPVALPTLYKIRGLAFYLFLLNVFIASGKATDFISNNQETSLGTILAISLLTAIICVFQFLLGGMIGKRQSSVERGLALGRKNTMFAIWLSLTYLNPVVALAPMFYILFQNIYNTVQMYALSRSDQR